MQKNSYQTPEEDALAATFTRHLVPIGLEYVLDERAISCIITAFLLQIREYAFLVTAGHVCYALKTVLEDPKCSGQSFFALDGGSANAKDYHPIPLDLDYIKRTTRFLEFGGYDYAFLGVREHYYDLFLSNGIVPLGEKFWDKPDPPGNDYVLAGVPNEWNVTGSSSNKKFEYFNCIKKFKGLSEKPEGMDEKPEGTVFGELPMDSKLSDISGMSGGPVFHVNVNEERKLIDYKLAGVQSVWREKRFIAAPPIGVVIETLMELIEEEHGVES